MKRFTSRSQPLILILCTTCLVSVSCKSANCVESVISEVESQKLNVESQRNIDTIYQHDSIYIREIQRGDTIYLTRTEWRDRWRIREVHDTIHNTEYITQTEYRDRVVEKPPERYVPCFYKWCAGLLAGVLIILIIIITLKIRNRILIKRSSS